MYVIRRVWEVKPGMARKYATVARKVADAYAAAGQRTESKIYFNGGTLPGERNRVYMEWTAETIESPYREGNQIPQSVRDAGAPGRDLVVDNWIEFYELLTPSKMEEG